MYFWIQMRTFIFPSVEITRTSKLCLFDNTYVSIEKTVLGSMRENLCFMDIKYFTIQFEKTI